MCKLPVKGPQHNADGNMAPRWKLGTFLRYSRESNSYVLHSDEDGYTTSRAVMRRPVEDRWKMEKIQNIKVTPWDLIQKNEIEVTFKPADEKLEEFEDKAVGAPRRFKITRKDLELVGFTGGCPQCDCILRDGKARGGLQHSERCRARVIAEISKTSAGKARVDKA